VEQGPLDRTHREDFLEGPVRIPLAIPRILALAALAATLGAAQASLDKVTLQLKWHHQFQFAGYYAAQQQGYYREAGLDVDILEADPGIDVVREVVSGRAQFGVGTSALLLSRREGQPVVVLAVIFQHSPLVLVARADAGISSVQDLAGKRLMIEPHSDELIAYLHREGVGERSMTLLEHTFDPQDLIKGKVDCMSAYQTDETYFLDQARFKYLTFSPRMGGSDFYGDNLFTSRAELEAHPGRVKAFREASLKGWKYAMQHPEEIADLIIAQYGERRGRGYLLYEAQKMATLLRPDLVEMGYMYPGRWQHIIRTYEELGLLPKGFDPEGFLYEPEAGVHQVNRRLAAIIAVLVALGLLLGGIALILFRLSLRLKKEVASREEAERAQKRQATLLRTLISTVPDLIWFKDPQGVYQACNLRCEQFFGAKEAEVVGKTDHDFVARELADRFREDDLKALAQGGLRVNEERVFFADDGHEECLETIKTPVVGADGQVLGVIGIGRDITARKRAEEALRDAEAKFHRSQKMESLGRLAGGVAHDMNNVLGAILGLASVHMETQPAGDPIHQAFTTIAKACARGKDLVHRLLGFARQGLAEERELDLNELVRDQVRILERTTLARIRVEMDLAPDLRPIRGEASALAHLLMNLCINAVDALPDNGTLTLRSRNVDSDWVEVQVEDDGCGMSREVLERAPEPFFTTKALGKGTGLGLSIVHSTVQAHHGQLEIQSEPGKGTLVKARFPAGTPSIQAGPAEEFPPEPARGSRRVLLVDDDELVQNSIQAILQALGHTVLARPGGEEALATLEAGFEPDVVILDMNMPGLGGAGTLPRLRALRPRLPILLATGRADQAAVSLVETYPNVTLLTKPFGLRELRHCLGELFPG
jgi:PAS domain S-box-containing protein